MWAQFERRRTTRQELDFKLNAEQNEKEIH